MGLGRKPDVRLGPFFRSRSRPNFPAAPGQAAAPGVQAVIEFLEGPTSEWTLRDLGAWLQEHLVSPRLMKRPQVLREPDATPLRMDPRMESEASLESLVAQARTRVLSAVRGLVAPQADDRFLNAAIYGGRVRRGAVNGKPAWVACPREIDFLSDMVLSLLAADVLVDRDYYHAHLGLCDACGRVTFREGTDPRPLCSEHRTSGFTVRVR